MYNGRVYPGMELGSCTLLRVLRHSNAGISFLARHAYLQELVVVEVVISPTLLLSPKSLAHLLAHFRRIASNSLLLAHPHILSMLEYGEQDGIAYIVTPYLRNVETLKAYMTRAGQLPLYMIQNFLEQIVDALTYAHTKGIVHGSITPAHLLLKERDTLLITEFGIAQFLIDIQPMQAATMQPGGGALHAEDPAYVAPEQLLHGKIDISTDIYALGILLYHLITGNLPYTAISATDLLLQHLQDRLPMPRSARPELPEACEQALLRAIAPHPKDRYRKVDDLKQDFCSVALPSTSIGSQPHSSSIAISSLQQPLQRSTTEQEPAARSWKTIEPSSPLKMRLKAQAGVRSSFTQPAFPILPRRERKLFSLSVAEPIPPSQELPQDSRKRQAGLES